MNPVSYPKVKNFAGILSQSLKHASEKYFRINISYITVMSDGLPSPNSTCDALFPGRTGHPKGILESPGTKSHLFQRLEGPLQCTKSLVPSDSQSLTLTVGASGYNVGLVTYQVYTVVLKCNHRPKKVSDLFSIDFDLEKMARTF